MMPWILCCRQRVPGRDGQMMPSNGAITSHGTRWRKTSRVCMTVSSVDPQTNSLTFHETNAMGIGFETSTKSVN